MSVEHDLILTYLLTHLSLPLTASSVVLNFVTHVYLPGFTLDYRCFSFSFRLTLNCQWNKAQSLLICLLTWTYPWLPVGIGLHSFNRLDHLDLLILRSLILIQKHFLDFLFFLCHFACYPQLYLQLFIYSHIFSLFFHCLILSAFLFSLLSCFQSFFIFPHF